MGTNYYLHEKACSCCGRSDEPKHIGKSSAGWCFSLHVDDEFKSLDDWIAAWSKPGVEIKNEYGEWVSKDEMLDNIRVRGRDTRGKFTGYASEEEMFQINHAIWGPNNLLRHSMAPYMFCGRSSPSSCIGYGDGPWDLITGDFS